MISQNALHHAENCRYCFMCRHLCPVQLQTGKEINTPRAKGLVLSMINKGTENFDEGVARAMYECMLCDACVDDCATGFQPPVYIREARTEAVVNDLAPAEVNALIENIENSGNIYGMEKPSFAQYGIDVLVYIGEVAACKAPKMAENFLALLKKAGVSAKVLENEPASGAMLADLAGYIDEVAQQAKALTKAVGKVKLPTLVVLDSYDAEIIKQQYPKFGCELKQEVITATAFVAQLIAQGKLEAKAANGIQAACHDDDRLARTFNEYEPIRAMSAAAGYETVEMFNKRNLAKSCGTAVALEYMPEITVKVAGGRWEDLKRTTAKTMLVASPQAYICLEKAIPEGYELVDLFGALL